MPMDQSAPASSSEREPAPAQPAKAVAAQSVFLPTQTAPKGVRFDFNDGARIFCPQSDAEWLVRLTDCDTGNVLYETKFVSGLVNSTARYFVHFRLEVLQDGKHVLDHEYLAEDREVLIRFPVDTLGDVIGWLPFAIKFKDKHRCNLTVAMESRVAALFREAYPDIKFITTDDVVPDHYYATYTVAVFFKGGTIHDHKSYLPSDVRFVGLHRAAAYVLGVDPGEERPRIRLPSAERPMAEPYVCIAVQSTLQAKYWNNPTGWGEVVRFLKSAGYRVLCIDQKPRHGKGNVWTRMPAEAEDFTGDRPLIERAWYLKHADFFVGLSSGLSWLAWAMEAPVVMISGVSHPLNEFENPYRVINYHVCNSCWNDPKGTFDRNDFMSCPRHQNTSRQFECTRLITADQVKSAIRSIPAFAARVQNAMSEQPRKRATYFPGVFDVATMTAAKSIILTPEGSTTGERWKVETPYVAELIAQSVPLSSDSIVLDYGCGIGRMAKELITRHGCSVVGVDISEKMRALAPEYVKSPRFQAVSPAELDALVASGQRFDAAISIWVLQHCLKPADDIQRIKAAVRPDGRVFILNNIWRAIPTIETAWANDGLDIKALLKQTFQIAAEGRLPADKTTESLANIHFWGAFRNSDVAKMSASVNADRK